MQVVKIQALGSRVYRHKRLGGIQGADSRIRSIKVEGT